jgi:acyl-CoA synthetase (AMP-forming)/AMP-acid ligase II
MRVPDLLANAVERFPERPCVIEGEGSLSFAAADGRADRLAQAFAGHGLRPGDRVALLAKSELEYLEIQVASQRAGLILVPLNQRLATPELRAILSNCEPALLIHGPGYAETAAELGLPVTWHLKDEGVGDAYEAVLRGFEPTGAHVRLDAQLPCSILYTSGTTGRSKGAVTSNGALWAHVNLMALEIGMRPGDSFLFPIPLFHVSSAVAYAFAYRGCTVVLMRDFDPAGAVAAMARHRTSHAVFVPTMIGRVVEELGAHAADLPALRLVLYGGSAISPELLRRALATLGCDFLQGYGLTEALNAAMLRTDEHDPDGRPELLASAGKATISYEVRVVDTGGRELPAGEVGELVIRGPGVMDGYWNAPEDTARALRGGWLHTGDLGHRSDDGYLYITDRLKDVIVSGGENVYSREVEDALSEHPGVLEVAVIGIPSARWGEAVHGVVVPRPGARLDPDELLASCRGRLAGYKLPKSVEVVDDLPKNASGKILKREIRDAYWRETERAVG